MLKRFLPCDRWPAKLAREAGLQLPGWRTPVLVRKTLLWVRTNRERSGWLPGKLLPAYLYHMLFIQGRI